MAEPPDQYIVKKIWVMTVNGIDLKRPLNANLNVTSRCYEWIDRLSDAHPNEQRMLLRPESITAWEPRINPMNDQKDVAKSLRKINPAHGTSGRGGDSPVSVVSVS